MLLKHQQKWILTGLLASTLFVTLGGCASQPSHDQLQTPTTQTNEPANQHLNTAGTQDPALHQLKHEIESYINQSRFAASIWGIDVITVDSKQNVYSHKADKLVIPASNTKLYTAALALSTLPQNYRIKTTLYATQPFTGTNLKGNLILYGRGDPSLGSGSDEQAPTHWADDMAKQMADRGIRYIGGDLIVDSTYFKGPEIAPGWEARDLQGWFAPPASAASVQGNTFSLRITPQGASCCRIDTTPSMPQTTIINHARATANAQWNNLSVYRPSGSGIIHIDGAIRAGNNTRQFVLAAPEPARMAGNILQDALVRQGIKLRGQVRINKWPRASALDTAAQTYKLAEVQSAPLPKLVKHTLKHSDNLYAQLLWLQVGAYLSGQSPSKAHNKFTEDISRTAMNHMLRTIGISQSNVDIEEGSGLSRKNIVTARATTDLLAWVRNQDFAHEFYAALPIAAKDGTLRNRMKNTPAANKLHAKTGTLRHSYAVSGYLDSASGKKLAVAVYLDNYIRPGNPSPQQDIDHILAKIAAY